MGLELDPKEIGERFGNGICCSMSVFGELAPLMGLDRDIARKIAAGFCGGVERNNFCGCVSAAKMALGLKYGGCQLGDLEQVKTLRRKIREFEELFVEEFGGIYCPEVLGGLDTAVLEDKIKINELRLHETTCTDAVCFTVELISEMLMEDDL